MPFITEELWQNMEPRAAGATILFAPTPKAGPVDTGCLDAFDMAEEAVNAVRGIRQARNLGPKEALPLKIKGAFPEEMLPVIEKLALTASIEMTGDFGDSSAGVAFMVRTVEMFVPLTGLVNVGEEIAKLEKDLDYQRQFLENVRRKLSNEAFVTHAKEAVVANERKKEADALSRIESLESQLKSLKANR